jgi:hypothetical protein
MNFYKPFKKLSDAEQLLGRHCTLEGYEAIFQEVKLNGKRLEFTFVLADGKGKKLNPLSAFYVVSINNHPFGEEVESEE